MENSGVFDGFMPTIVDISISKPTSSITSSGELTNVHCITITTADKKQYVFSMSPMDLYKLYFLLIKILV
jgi:hypothetical protein